jgi:ABC-type multidrug transport system fused ATPase/permease subunit
MALYRLHDGFCRLCYRVLVLDAGRIMQFDKPNILLADREGLFFSLARDAGLV